MAGIYIHIPFCKSKCGYCGFYSLPSLKLKDRFLEALKAEIVERKDYLQRGGLRVKPAIAPVLEDGCKLSPIETIYFGGGTPSLLSVDEIQDLLHLINKHYPIAENPEITLEANPDTLSLDYLKSLRNIGINRLSIGIQSFFDNDLKYLGRKHDACHARQCLDWARQAGFSNISIDLIYGLPTSNAEQWNQNLDLFFEYDLPHLSAYALTLEPNSILTKQIELGKAQPISDDDALRGYHILCQRAAAKGFLHYEISNFCQRGMHSKHNASYWFGTPYLGLGPSAHSFDGASRQWNVSSVEKYCSFSFCNEKEQLTPEQQYDEYVMLRLRTHWGIDLKWLKREMGERFSTYCERQALPLIAQGRLSQTREFLYLTDQQMLFADGVAEELFI
ncbi:MAG: radical SAM family heme chaperone HemW [Bacteroidales bacterium]|nr:radical SAM family heme chaperone HemW [Bacteroidales bacterium]